MLSAGSSSILGEVYTVTKEQLDAFDRWEETPEVYQRLLGQLRDGRWVSVYMQSTWGIPAAPSEQDPRI